MKIEQFNEVIELIENGLSLRKACEKLGYSTSSFNLLLKSNNDLMLHYAHAKDLRTELIFEEILEIADNTELGETTTETDKGIYTTTGDMTAHRKLKIDARKWMLGKMNRKKYGDGIDVTTDGEKINNIPNVINVKIVNPIEEDDESDQL